MAREMRIYRSTPFDPLAQDLLVPPKSAHPPDLSDITGNSAYFYIAERSGVAQGCIAMRNMGTFGLVSAFRFISELAHSSLPDILIEQVETQARSLRLGVLRTWVDRLHPIQSEALRRNGFFPQSADKDGETPQLYERPLRKGAAPTAKHLTPPNLRR